MQAASIPLAAGHRGALPITRSSMPSTRIHSIRAQAAAAARPTAAAAAATAARRQPLAVAASSLHHPQQQLHQQQQQPHQQQQQQPPQLRLQQPRQPSPAPAGRSSSQRRQHTPQALAGGGAGSLGGSGSDGGGRGGGGGGGDAWGGKPGDGDGSQQPAGKGWVWRGWAERVAADPEFAFKVLLEQVIGVGASVIGDMSSRPNWGLNELDFVFATLVVGSIVNFSLMYLLAPTAATASAAGAAAGSSSLLARLLSDDLLLKWGAPGGNMFQPGFPLHKRLLNFGYKGAIFAVIGMMAGTVGTSVSNGLLALRKRLDPTFAPQNEPPPVLGNAACWALHMGLSSNLRYQMLGGADGVLSKVMPMPVFRAYSATIRGLNNIVGGISFVTIARVFGVQKSGTSEGAAPAQAAARAA